MNILVVAAHPDDEILGCGGTIAKLSGSNDVYILILGEGLTSRSGYDREKLAELKEEVIKANNELGVKEVMSANLPDNKFDSLALLDVVKKIEEIIEKIKPEIVFTHSIHDLNVDHRMTHKAVVTACRPVQNSCVKKLYAFEVLSSSEWNSTQLPVFVPNVYVDISKYLDKKIEAMKTYKSEIREYPHPRSEEAIRALAMKRGSECGFGFAESFVLIRSKNDF
jgi:LmbE family N-acetylglucosaminyl deacetylase